MNALALISSPVTRYAAIILAVIAFIGHQRHDAASEVRDQTELQNAREFRDTLERINEEPAVTDSATALRRLCELAGVSPCPLPGDKS